MFFVTGSEVGGVAPGRPVAENPDSRANPDTTEDHPQHFARYPPRQRAAQPVQRSACEVGVSIAELAEDIARRTLLASLTFGTVLDEHGAETRLFDIPVGWRRYRVLEPLVKQKRIARIALMLCIVRTDGLAEEDSLVEECQRAPLHHLDQFRAFQATRD